MDLHNYSGRLERALLEIKNSHMSEENKKAIEDFKSYLIIKGLSLARIENYVQRLKTVALILNKSFLKTTKEDLVKVLEEIISNKNWSERYKYDFKISIRAFFRWLKQTYGHDVEIDWIKATHTKKSVLPEEILTEDEVKRIAEKADNPRDRAFVLVLYESGCRIGEILSLRIKHVQSVEHGMSLSVNGKTGSRRVLIISSAPALANWLNLHPFKDNPEAFVWLGIGNKNKNQMLRYGAVYDLLKKLAKLAGVNKRVTPHAFRHARATHLANCLTEAQMKQFFGWIQGSDMASIYVHLSGRDVDDALLRLNGLSKDEIKKQEILKVQFCPRCDKKNSPASKFCCKCGSVLDLKTALEIDEKRRYGDEVISMLAKDPEIQAMIIRKAMNEQEFREKLRKIV
ncbi:MAG: tyrosine-type recombinase/integrase [Nitrososphaerales archaeon]